MENHPWNTGKVGTLMLCLILATLAPPAPAAPLDADLLLRGGTICDGSGADTTVGDVAVRDGRIVAVGKVTPGKIGRTIDCRGMVVAPGLIDLHTHSDGTFAKPEVRPSLNYVLQGCTTMGTGNCGGSSDVGSFLKDLDAKGAGTNIVHLVGHGTVRAAVLGSARRAPTAEELDRMKTLVAQAMRDGAWGMSTGLIYAPSSYAQTDELIALARVVAAHGGIYVSHIRNEADHVMEAVAEAIRIGRESGAPVHISHFKSMEIPNWGRIRKAAAMIEKAHAQELKITADQYPYTANSHSLADATLPDAEIEWCKRADLGKRMASDPAFAALVRRVIADHLRRSEKIVIAESKDFPSYVGKSLKEIAAREKINAVDLVLKIVGREDPQIVNHSMSEDDVRWAMALPWVATASDGSARTPNPLERHHPRNFGTFARKIGRYAIQDKVISLPHAVRSATGLPADIFGIPERGYLRPGYWADIVVFDPAVYRDQATFDKPQEYATGVRYVFLAGQAAVDDGKPSPRLLGRALRHQSAKPVGKVAAQDWPRYGHDGALTGRCPIRGAITSPHVAWTYSVAGRELRLELEPAPGEHRAVLSAAAAAEPGSPRFVPAGPPQLDLDGRGTLRPALESYHERWAKILPGIPGYQRVAWNHTWTDQAVCRLQLFAYDRGFDQPRRVWESAPPEAVIFNPLNVVYDIDGDGVPEICVAAHYRVMVFEGTTGRKESELRYHSCRPYGWFGLADVDGDGQMELVTIGEFQSHVDVLKYDRTRPESQRLSVLWRRDIETNIEERKKWPQVGPHPLADVNGDGRPELILNLFNDTGDGQWHAVVLDATSGRTLWDFPQRFVQGSADVDGDGATELFLTTTSGELVPASGTIELIGFEGQKPAVRQSCQNAGWCLADLPCFGPTWSTTASQGMQHVLVRGKTRPTFFVKTWEPTESRRIALSAMRCRADRRTETLWKLENLPDASEAIVLDGNAKTSGVSETLEVSAAMVRVRLAANETAAVAGHNVRPRIVENGPLGIEVSMPIVAQVRAGQGRCVVVEGPGQQVFAVAPPRQRAERPQLLWQRPGRGMRDGSRAVGLLAADLDGDGACEVVAADRAREGHARLVAYRGDGTALWEKAFPQTDGASPSWNVGALTFWWPGRFRQTDAIDLFVNTRRGLMHSDVGHLVDGRNATTIWTRDKAELAGEFRWGYAGIPLAAVDVNADRLDELVSLYPVCFWIAEGRTGRITAGKELASRRQLPAWAAYGEPMVYDFNGAGRPQVLLDSPYLLALLDASGKPLWHGPGRIDFPVRPDEGNVGQTTNCRHALVDIDGDGKFEIASAGYGNGVRLIDPRTGKVLWGLAAPAPTGPRVTAANIDGRGGDEILYPAGNALVAITGDRTAGRLLWTWQGPAALSLPAVADVDGDGLAEIVVQDAAGTVHCLGAAPPP